jgi:RNA polymerase sigma factor (sigma-70 family)
MYFEQDEGVLWYESLVRLNYKRNVDFSALQTKSNLWMEQTFALLSHTNTFYEMIIRHLQVPKVCKAVFTGYYSDLITMYRYRDLFIRGLSRNPVPYRRLARIAKSMRPTRHLLFKALLEEIDRFAANSIVVPEWYLELRAEYLDIINQLCASCYRLVVKLARRIRTDMLPLSDRIGYGNVGLLLAAHKYDFNLLIPGTNDPYPFGTYAGYWICDNIRYAIDRTAYKLTISQQARAAYHDSWRDKAVDPRLLEEARNAVFLDPLDAPVDEEERSIADTVDNSYSLGSPIKGPEEVVGKQDWADAASKVFSEVLDEREYPVVWCKFEILNGEGEMTATCIAKLTGVGKYSVQSVLNLALEKLRNSTPCMVIVSLL